MTQVIVNPYFGPDGHIHRVVKSYVKHLHQHTTLPEGFLIGLRTDAAFKQEQPYDHKQTPQILIALRSGPLGHAFWGILLSECFVQKRSQFLDPASLAEIGLVRHVQA